MSRIQFADLAKADVRSIWDFVALERQSPENADRLLAFILDKLNFLADFPLMGELRDDLSRGLRCFSAGSYAIYYRPLTNCILVERILHGAQDVRSCF
jgi:toxin ParE1/3/4